MSRLVTCEAEHPIDSLAADAYLHAAIVFGKSIVDWLTDQHRDENLSREASARNWLKEQVFWNARNKFFATTRDLAIHEDGTVETTAAVNVTVKVQTGQAIAQGGVHIARVTYPNPTPDQMEEIEHERVRDEVRANRLRETIKREREEWRERVASESTGGEITHTTTLKFVGDPLDGKPVVAEIGAYLEDVERLLHSASS